MDPVKCLLISAVFICCCCVHGTTQQNSQSQGGWGLWQRWSECSATCGVWAKRTRVRTWVTAPGEQRLEVPFTNTDHDVCNMDPCPRNGSWSGWGVFTECNKGCGGGVKKRHRDCNSPPPMYNGADCEGEKFEEEACNELPCPSVPAGFNLTVCQRANMFMCKNKLMCVNQKLRCDDKPQCSDGTDEMGCYRRGVKIGRVHFSNASSRPWLSPAGPVLTMLLSLFYNQLSDHQ